MILQVFFIRCRAKETSCHRLAHTDLFISKGALKEIAVGSSYPLRLAMSYNL